MPKGKTLSPAQKEARDKERANKFKELGSKRLNNALVAIGRLQSLANKNQYVYTDEQVGIIRTELNKSVEAVLDSFKGKTVNAGGVAL